eukprot:g27954.t1
MCVPESPVTYTGYRVNRTGLHPLEDKVMVMKDTPAPMSQWTLILSAYNYKLEHHLGGQVANVVALSCLPLADTPPVEQSILVLNFLDILL